MAHALGMAGDLAQAKAELDKALWAVIGRGFSHELVRLVDGKVALAQPT